MSLVFNRVMEKCQLQFQISEATRATLELHFEFCVLLVGLAEYELGL